MVKVIIAGGRKFENYLLLKMKCNKILAGLDGKIEVQIVSGGAAGADTLGERYARERHYIVKRFEADWQKHGNSAGYVRNKAMAEYADALIAFWDGTSPGTKMMIDLATERGLKVRVIKII